MTKEEALGLAAACWCDPRTSNREMDSELATVFAEQLLEVRKAALHMAYAELCGETNALTLHLATQRKSCDYIMQLINSTGLSVPVPVDTLIGVYSEVKD